MREKKDMGLQKINTMDEVRLFDNRLKETTVKVGLELAKSVKRKRIENTQTKFIN